MSRDTGVAASPGEWLSTNEALLIDTSHVQQWNMAVVGDGGKTPEGLVAMAWGSSPEGVARRARLIAAAPAMLAALERTVVFYDALDRGHAVGEARLLDGLSAIITRARGEAQ